VHCHTVCVLPPVTLLNVATASVPVHFWYQWQLHLWPLLTHAFLMVDHHYTLSTSCTPTETKLVGSSQVTVWAKQPVRFFQSIFLHNSCTKIPLPFSRNMEVSCHVVAIFVVVFIYIYVYIYMHTHIFNIICISEMCGHNFYIKILSLCVCNYMAIKTEQFH